jgi:hypothetical protein
MTDLIISYKLDDYALIKITSDSENIIINFNVDEEQAGIAFSPDEIKIFIKSINLMLAEQKRYLNDE